MMRCHSVVSDEVRRHPYDASGGTYRIHQNDGMGDYLDRQPSTQSTGMA